MTWRHRLQGALVLGLGALAISTPFFVGDWTLIILGLVILLVGLVELANVVYSPDQRTRVMSYLSALSVVLVGLLFFFRPTLVLSAFITILAALFVLDGIQRMLTALWSTGPGRLGAIESGLLSLILGLTIWWLRAVASPLAIGLCVGLWMLSHGWAMLMVPSRRTDPEAPATSHHLHPDRALGLNPHEAIGACYAATQQRETLRWPIDLMWCLTFVLVFFAIHIGRMEFTWTWLSFISPSIAVLGDLIGALLLSAFLLLPARLLWRKLSRPLERRAWHQRLAEGESAEPASVASRLRNRWLDGRMRLAMRLEAAGHSLWYAMFLGMQAGLPLVAMLIAINPIWGFSWYFNSENWASAFWQEVAARRTVTWREAMIGAVQARYPAIEATSQDLFEVHPPGLAKATDFSFLVIGDPGEGDGSQWSLKDNYLRVSQRQDVQFVVISSDVIYPDGAMKDYEPNFYLPFKGVTQPIYAIPGNHDWFNALDSFAANFFEPDAARASMLARVEADLRLSSTTERRIDTLIREADRLRTLYRVQTGRQRGPFFQVQTEQFALIAVDTGVLRRLDPAQEAWLKAALERSRGKFTMVLLGHPFYAGGYDQGATDDRFGRLHDLLRQYDIPLVMAGDTHDFEYYREMYDTPAGPKAMHHVLNGGGGAYLSIGTALAWPRQPPVRDYAFYPSTDAVYDKLNAQTPLWKWPVWWWIKQFKAWPVSVEALSAVFDFNAAPFFQSFVEVRVQPSEGVVRLILHGVDGPLHWRDLQQGGQVLPAYVTPDHPVEFVIPIDPQSR
jgi:uncharacterized membrane protein HdeD (DUF308 family)/3',5'-cyclic AMP phosphodiesterase CpdA